MTDLSGALVDYKRNPTARPIRATVVESFDGHARITYPARGGQSSELVRLDQLVVVPQSHADRANAFHKNAVKAGKAAADAARKAGLELLAAKDEVKHGEWKAWCKSNLTFSLRTAQAYMQLAKAQRAASMEGKSVRSALRDVADSGNVKRAEAKLKEKLEEQDRQDQLRHRMDVEAQACRTLREKRRDVVLDFIATGFKAMSKKTHPDRGGSTEAQIQVTEVRDLLVEIIKNPTPCIFCGK